MFPRSFVQPYLLPSQSRTQHKVWPSVSIGDYYLLLVKRILSATSPALTANSACPSSVGNTVRYCEHIRSSGHRTPSHGIMNTPAGTPDTRLITHAQDGIPIESTDTHLNHIRGQSGTLSPLALHENASLHLEKDPFVTPSRDTRLSPTASSFTPVKSRPLDVNQTSPSTVSAILSSELGLSRTLRLSAAEQPEPREVEKWLAVSWTLSLPRAR